MGFFYKASDKELLEIRKKIFTDHGLPPLTKNGFVKSPFSTSWFGKDDLGGYQYDLCRLNDNDHLEMLNVYILRRDKWIKVDLNIFKLKPHLQSVDQLQGLDGVQFSIPPNSRTKMRLRNDDIKGPPLLSYDFWFKQHKLSGYYTRSGLTSRANELGKLLETDLENIDHFVRRWHELHRPLVTSWEGLPLSEPT